MAEIRHFYLALTIIADNLVMPDHERSEPSSIDQPRDSDVDCEGLVDGAAYAAAKFYGAVALPLGLSFAKAVAIEMQASMAQSLDGAENFIDGGSSGPIGELTPDQRKKKAEEDDAEFIATMLDENEREQKRQREREEWSRTVSTVAGVSMTGAQWAALAERLRSDEDLRRRLIEALEAKGATHDEAVTRADRVAELAEAASVPPKQWNAEQKAIMNDPQAGADLQVANRLADRDPESRHSPQSLSGRFEAAAEGRDVPHPQPPATTPPPRPVVTIAPGSAF